MLPLLKKELRGLLPLLLLILIFQSGDILMDPLLKRPDEICWGANSAVAPDHGGGEAFGLLLMGFLAAFSLFPREHEEGTIEFLYALPVSRPTIFLSKVLAAVFLLWFSVIWGLGTSVVLSSPNHDSLGGDQFRLGLGLEVAALHSAYAAIVVCYGVLLSFLRRFGLLLFAVFAWAVIALKEAQPSLAFLDGTRICSLEYQGSHLVWPVRELAFHGAMSLVSLVLAYVLWMGPAERAAQAFVRFLGHTVGKLALGCAGFLVVVLGIGLFAWSMRHEKTEVEAPDDMPSVVSSWETARAETNRYQFTYPVSNRDAALELVRAGDGICERVAAALGTFPEGKIVADLTETSGEHAGIAGWKKVRIDLRSDKGPTWLRYVLAHETTHAFEFQESQRKLAENHASAEFFIEGLAERIAMIVEPRPEALAASRLVAAAAWRRGKIRFEDLASHERLRERHDPQLVYMLGESWCAALEESCGREAAGRVLRAIGRPDAPRGLDPLAFWQDTLQACGYDLERVNAAWSQLLEKVEADEAATLAKIPRLSGAVVAQNSAWIVVRARIDGPLPQGRLLCRTRESSQTPDTRLNTVHALAPKDPDSRTRDFDVPRAGIEGDHVEIQLGQMVSDEALPLWEDWQAAKIPR